MPRIAIEKMRGGPFAAVDYAGRHYGPGDLSEVRCPVCDQLLVVPLAEAGETTHPACSGWPREGRRGQIPRQAPGHRR